MITPRDGPLRPDTVRVALSHDTKSYGNTNADSSENHLILKSGVRITGSEAELRVLQAVSKIPWSPTIGQIRQYGRGLSGFSLNQIRDVVDRLAASGYLHGEMVPSKCWLPPRFEYHLVKDQEVARG